VATPAEIAKTGHINNLHCQSAPEAHIGRKGLSRALSNYRAVGPPGIETAAPADTGRRRQGNRATEQRPHPYRKPHPSSNWKSIGDVAARILLRVRP
jgi:hypothetical protein